MKKWFLLTGVVAVGIVGFAIFHLTTSKKDIVTAEIQISASGFSPSSLVVKKGTQIIWKNVDAAPHAVASNPYPSNSSVKELRSQTILPQGTYAYTVKKTGVINYHDDTQPTHNASVKVGK